MIYISLAATATSTIFVTTKVLWQQTHVYRNQTHVCRNKTCLLLQQKYETKYFCHNKTHDRHDKYLSRQSCVCRDKHTFVMTKDTFCHDKHMFVATKVSLSLLWENYVCHNKCFVAIKTCLSRQKFYCDKHILSWQRLYLWQLPPTIFICFICTKRRAE